MTSTAAELIAEARAMGTEDRTEVAAMLDRLADALEAATTGAEWEYGYTSKWGVYAASSKGQAQASAHALRESIGGGRESGDLEYHGRVVRRKVPVRGNWEPVGGTE